MGIQGIDTYNVKDNGAVGDGASLDTLAIQPAIDARPALICDSVEDIELAGFRAMGIPEGSLISFTNVQQAFIHGSRPLTPVGAFVSVHDQLTSGIVLEGNNLHNANLEVDGL